MLTRPAQTSDIHTIYRFICDLEETVLDFSLFEQYYLQNIANKNYLYLVAVDKDNAVIGYISCHGQALLHHAAMVFEIQEMYVDKHYRQQGVGQQLINALEEWLQKNNHHLLEVTANIIRTGTHHFYSRAGFTQTHLKFTKMLGKH